MTTASTPAPRYQRTPRDFRDRPVHNGRRRRQNNPPPPPFATVSPAQLVRRNSSCSGRPRTRRGNRGFSPSPPPLGPSRLPFGHVVGDPMYEDRTLSLHLVNEPEHQRGPRARARALPPENDPSSPFSFWYRQAQEVAANLSRPSPSPEDLGLTSPPRQEHEPPELFAYPGRYAERLAAAWRRDTVQSASPLLGPAIPPRHLSPEYVLPPTYLYWERELFSEVLRASDVLKFVLQHRDDA